MQNLQDSFFMLKRYQSINNIYSDFKTKEINSQLQKVSKLQSKIRVEKRVMKHL